jgi:hypothetical protein
MPLGCKVLISSKRLGQCNCMPFLNKSHKIKSIISNGIILQRRKVRTSITGAEVLQHVFIYFHKPKCLHPLVDGGNHVYHLFYNLEGVHFTGVSYLFRMIFRISNDYVPAQH